MRRRTVNFTLALLLLSLLALSATAQPFVLVLSPDDLIDALASAADGDDFSTSEWDEFGDSDAKPEELDPGSWRPIFEPDSTVADPETEQESLYYSGVANMVAAVSSGEPRVMDEAASEIEVVAAAGYPHAQSALGFLYNMGMSGERNRAKGKGLVPRKGQRTF
ncbi:hypothetical protein U1Q18_020007 [Sarracenia purpurea var. burkii]